MSHPAASPAIPLVLRDPVGLRAQAQGAPLRLEPPARRPLRLRALPPEAAVWQDRLARMARSMELTAGGAKATLRLGGPREAVAPARGPRLDLTIAGEPATLSLDWGVARRAAGEAVEAVPGEDAALMLEEGLSAWIDAAEAAGSPPIRLVSLAEAPVGPAPSPLPVAASLVLTPPGAEPVPLALRLSVPAARALAGALARRRGDDAPADPVGLRLLVALERGGARLTPSELASLEPGDAVLMPAPRGPGTDPDTGQDARLVVGGRLAAAAEPRPGGARLSGRFAPIPPSWTGLNPTPQPSPGAAAMPQTPQGAAPRPAQGGAIGEADLGALEVRVTFRAGEASMTVAELRALAPGAIVETTAPADAVVIILANGAPVGTGELIEVAGRRAVEIRTMHPPGQVQGPPSAPAQAPAAPPAGPSAKADGDA